MPPIKQQACPICNRKVSLRNLNVHLRLHVPEKAAVGCEECQDAFLTEAELQAHKLDKHPKSATTSVVLGRILDGKHTIKEIITTVTSWINDGKVFDKALPPDVVEYLRKEDARIQLLLRLIAIQKVQRVMSVSHDLQRMDDLLSTKIQNPQWQADATADMVTRQAEKLQDSIQKDLSFLKDISELNQLGVSEVVDLLSTVFSKIPEQAGIVHGYKQSIGVPMPTDPIQREYLRVISQQDGDVVLDGEAPKKPRKKRASRPETTDAGNPSGPATDP